MRLLSEKVKETTMTYHNSEGYPDPTAGEALAAIAREARAYKPLVYIASPYAGDTETNAANAMTTGSFAQVCEDTSPTLMSRDFKAAPIVNEAYSLDRAAFNQGQNANTIPQLTHRQNPIAAGNAFDGIAGQGTDG
jgi:hypothetical protein